MKSERTQLRIGIFILVCCLLVQLFFGGAWDMLRNALSAPEVLAFLFYTQTGKRVTVFTQPDKPDSPITETGNPLISDTPPAAAVFSPEDAAVIEVTNYCGYSVDREDLVTKPLSWNLTQDGPAVLIVHTHATESYTKTEHYQESSGYRTLNTDYNVVSIGSHIAEKLEAGGIQVIHDTSLHDYPSYNDSYENSRKSVQQYLQEYPSIRLVLDIHRDAIESSSGNQISYTVDCDGREAAQVMLVVGTDANGLTHPNWRDNMALAMKLCAQLEKNTPGICRPISFRKQRFNQDLSAGALLLEMGAAGNTRQEALLAAELVAQGILDLAYGAVPGELS